MKHYEEKMIREMKIRNFSEGTQQAYLYTAERIVGHFDRDPQFISSDEIKDYLLDLQKVRSLKNSTIETYLNAMKFLINVSLNRKDDPFIVEKRKREKPLPSVLSKDELRKVFSCTTNLLHRTIFMTAYCAGLRISEVQNLKVSDIDSSRMVIHVHMAKNRKDRYTILTPTLLDQLRAYWRKYRPKDYLFVNRSTGLPYRDAYHAFKKTFKKSGIQKKVCFHTLRHCFATHMLEAGVDLRTIQVMMGHSSIQTTADYLKITTATVGRTAIKTDLLEDFIIGNICPTSVVVY